jgi:hypothetical protein
MFDSFKKSNILFELNSFTVSLKHELEKLKNLEISDIPLEKKKEQIEKIKSAIDTIEDKIDTIKSRIKLDTDFKNN